MIVNFKSKEFPEPKHVTTFGFFVGCVDVFGNEYAGLFGTWRESFIDFRHEDKEILEKVCYLYENDQIEYWIVKNPSESLMNDSKLKYDI